MDEQEYIAALIRLHNGLERQGPGDTAYSEFILSQLPPLPDEPRIADIGCGAGVATLMLAERFGTRVKAVDFSSDFLDQLMRRAEEQGLGDLVEHVECDMGALGWEPGSIDLLWSEGAAYSIGFDNAMRHWQPLLSSQGVAAVSEMSYFVEDVPEEIAAYWQQAYPGIRTEQQNVEAISSLGYEVLSHHRLPSQAWWDNYYDPLSGNIEAMKASEDEVMQAVIRDTEQEMAFFRDNHRYYGYTFYIMKPA